MADRETNVATAFETSLTADLAAGATTIDCDTSGGPAVPCYLVIDPGNDALREVVYADGSKTASAYTLSTSANRGQDGTSDVAHSSGAKVVSVPVAALWTDVNDRIDADKTEFNDHSARHAQAGADELDVAELGSGAAAADQVPKADGAGGVAWGNATSLFTELTDTPADYVGAAGQIATVNASEDGLVFGDTPGGAVDVIDTAESTTSTGFTDLTTIGPQVTVDVPASGKCLIIIAARQEHDSTDGRSMMGWVGAGLAADFSRATREVHSPSGAPSTANTLTTAVWASIVTGLATGSRTFTAKYAQSGGTAAFQNRRLTVIPIPG